MIAVSNDFKAAMKRPIKELDAYIRIDSNNSITSADDLISIKVSCDSSMCKTAMRKLEAKYLGELNLLGKWVHVGFGVKLPSTGTFDYLDYGSFLITETTTSKDTGVTQIVAYDKMINSMTSYETLNVTYPITLYNYAEKVCEACNLTLGNASFTTNNNWQVTEELWENINGITYRDILQQIAQVTGTTCIISNDDKVYFKTINETNETITYDNLFKLKLEPIYGEINSVVLSREPMTGEDVFIKDDASIETNGLTEFKIDNNQIVDKRREDAITPIYNALHGISFYPFEANTEGLGWYEIGDNFDIINDTNDTFNTTLFNFSITVDGGIKETLKTSAETKTQTQYEYASKISKRLSNTEVTVNKQEETITALVDTTDTIQKEINPTDTSSGSSIYLEDSAETELIDFELEGKTEQETRSGKNKFNYKRASDVNNTYVTQYRIFKIDGLEPGEMYTFYNYNITSATPNAHIYLWDDERYSYAHKSYISNPSGYSTDGYNQLNANENGELFLAIYPTDVSTWDEHIGLFENTMLVKGSEHSQPYEPYGAMPSPDYPSELVSVGYENLAENDTISNLLTYAQYIDGNSSGQAKLWWDNINNLPKDTQIIANWNYTSDGTAVASYSGKIIKITYTDSTSQNIEKGISFIIPSTKTINYINVYGNQNATSNKWENIIFTKGTQAHSYIPYGKYGIEVKTTGESKFDINTISQNTYINSLTGAIGTSSVSNTSDYIEVLPNVEYELNYSYVSLANSSTRGLVYFNSSKEYIDGLAYSPSSKPITFTTPENTKYVRFTYDKNCTDITLYKIAEKGNTYLYTLDNPLRSIGDTKDLLYIKNGMLYVDRKIGKIVLNGSENWGASGTYTNDTIYSLYLVINDYKNSSKAASDLFSWLNSISASTRVEYIATGGNSIRIGVLKSRLSAISLSDFKNWLSTHNTEVQYILAEPYTEELGQVDMPSTYKGITYLDTTDELEPNMNITYVRDTVIANYVESHVSELKINEQGIESRVQTIEESDYGSRINAVEERTTDTEHSIEVISTNIDTTTGEVRKVTTTNGMTFDENGLNIHTNQSTFNAQHTYEGTYYRDGDEVITETTISGFKATNLKNKGQHEYSYDDTNDLYEFIDERIEADGEYCYATFYNGEE